MEKIIKTVLSLIVVFLIVSFRSLGCQDTGFVLGEDDSRNRAVTDPVPAWHTYLGSTGDDYSNAIALDAAGNIYLAGWSAATWGTPINPHSGGWDVFVAKLNSSGNSLVYSTFLGGGANDYGYGIAVDGNSGASIFV